MTIPDVHAMVNHRQIQKTKEGSCFYREKGGEGGAVLKESPLGESNSSGRQQLLIGWAAAFLIG